MRTGVIVALSVALVVGGALAWHHYCKKKQMIAVQFPLVSKQQGRPVLDSILPKDMEWDAVGSHLEQEIADVEHTYPVEDEDDLGPFMGIGRAALLWEQEKKQHRLQTAGLETTSYGGHKCVCAPGHCNCQ